MRKKENDPIHRPMIVDWEGTFILKPPTKKFPQISVVEDLIVLKKVRKLPSKIFVS
jgi:hypothetical protein